MKYYKNADGKLYAYDADGSQDAFIPADLLPVSAAEAEAIINPPPTPEQVKSAKIAFVQGHLDQTAKALGYDSIASAITYADEPAVPHFQNEGLAFRAWRSLVWARCYEILDEVQAGKRGVISDEELIAGLPELDLSAN